MKMHLTTCFRFNLFFFVIFLLIQGFPIQASPFLSDAPKALEARLVQSMGAEEDVITPSLEAIHGYLKTHPDEYPALCQALTPTHGPLVVRWQGYQPEVFVKRSKVLSKESYNNFISCDAPSLDHGFLSQLMGFLGLLEEIDLPDLHGYCQKVSVFYRRYLETLCRKSVENRKTFLIPRAMVFTESGNAYRLDQKTARALVSRSVHGFPLRSNASGNHLVKSHEGFHYKADDGRAPLTPSFEFLFSLADQLWQIPNRPLASSSAFLHFHQVKINQLAFDADFTNWYHERPRDDEDFAHYLQNHPGYQPRGTETVQSYAIQVSETILGESVEIYLDQHPVLDPSVFDGDHFGMQVVLSLMLRPYDAKADNFLLIDTPTGKRFVGIDNDCLLTPQVYQFQGHHYPGVRNILYTLAPLMKDPFSEDFKRHIQSLPATLPWTFLGGLFEKRRVYEDFAEHIGLSEEARRTYELSFHLRPGDFVDILKTWRAIQNAVAQPRTTTYEDLFHAVDPLTFSIYQALAKEYGGHPQRIMEAIYREAERTRLESIREHLSSGAQKTYDQGHWPKRDERREGRTRSLEASFLEGWQSPMVKAYRQRDIISFSQEMVRLKSILHETQWKPFLSNIKDAWPQEGLLADPKFPFALFKDNAFSPKCIDLWTQDLLKHLAFTDEEGQTLLHVLLSHRSPDVIERISLRPFRGLVNRPTPSGLTPLDLMAQGYHSVFSIESLLALGAWDVRAPQQMAAYIQVMGWKDTLFFAWAQEIMNRTPQVRWHVMLNDLLPCANYLGQGRLVQSTHLGQRLLLRKVEQILFDREGKFQRASKSGRREVGYVPWQGEEGLWFKVFPELPGREELARILCLETLTAGILPFPLIPPSMLLRIPYEGPWQSLSKEKLPCLSVLVSQGLGAQNFHQALEKDPQCHKRLDPESLGWIMVLTLLLNPEDGKPDNYVIQPHPSKKESLVLCSVDNDHLLVPPVALEKKSGPMGLRKSKTLQVKSIVYCLDQMKDRLDPTFIKALLSLDARSIITQWMEKIGAYDQSLGSLFKPQEVHALQKKESLLFVPFASREIPNVYRKLVKLQDLLAAYPSLSFLQLLMRIEPLLGKRYAQVLNDTSLTPMERFCKVDGEAYSTVMKGSFQTLCTGRQTLEHFMGGIVTRQDFLQRTQGRTDVTPAQALEEFQSYLREEESVLGLRGENTYGGEEASLMEAYLIKHPWAQIPQEKQRLLIDKMHKKAFRTLLLANCQLITAKDFKKLDLSVLSILDISGCPFVNDDVLTQLSQNCPTLVELDVSHTAITGIREVIQGWTQVYYHPFQGLCLEKLRAVNCPELTEIAKFDLVAPHLTFLDVPSLGFEELCSSKSLDFSSGKLKGNILSLFKKFPLIFVKVNAANNNIGPVGCQHLAALTGLTSLNVNSNKIGAAGCQHLAALTGLTHLGVGYNTIGDAGCQHLTALTGLTSLNVGCNTIGEAGCQYLAALTGLTSLNVWENNLSSDAKDQLHRSLPNCKIEF